MASSNMLQRIRDDDGGEMIFDAPRSAFANKEAKLCDVGHPSRRAFASQNRSYGQG